MNNSNPKPTILVLFGGDSAEHEVSIISGLQVIENIDRKRFDILPIYHSKKSGFLAMPDLSSRYQFKSAKKFPIAFGFDDKGGYISFDKLLSKVKVYPSCAYLAYHGGNGESGQMQGFLETLKIPFTSSSSESSSICMNKATTKELIRDKIPILDFKLINSQDVRSDSEIITQNILELFTLPVIVKPVHLGSSIGIKVCKTELDLEKALLEASFIDNEIMVEEFLTNFYELNISVKSIDGEIICSPIERPMNKDEILSFADKYERGAKKNSSSGMAGLDRELPAKIDVELQEKINYYAKSAYKICKCTGLVRIDFMILQDSSEMYLTEINPIPGSLSFYLWEADGMSFQEQIAESINESMKVWQGRYNLTLNYESDIVENFINRKK